MTETLDHPKSIDWSKCLELAQQNKAIANAALAAFIADLEKNLANILQSVENNDLNSMQDFVHKLHGGSYYCGVPRLSKHLAELDNQLKTASQHQLKELIQPIEIEAERIFQAYKDQSYENEL